MKPLFAVSVLSLSLLFSGCIEQRDYRHHDHGRSGNYHGRGYHDSRSYDRNYGNRYQDSRRSGPDVTVHF